MNVKFDKVDNVNGVLTVSLLKEDCKVEVKKELAELGRRRPLKGFRPGHVPAQLLQKMFGGEVLSKVVDRKVSGALFEYLRDNDLNVLGEPVLDKDTNVDLNTQEEYVFKFNIGIAPEIDVTIDNELTVPYYKIKVTDEMVADHDMQYRQRYGHQVTGEEVDEEALVRGTVAELNEDGTVKEGGITFDRAVLSPHHIHDAEQKALFIGKKMHEEVVYNPAKATDNSAVQMASQLNISKEQAADLKSDFRFHIDDILVNKPADYDEDLFDNVLGSGQATTKEEYLEKLREVVQAQFTSDSNYRFSIDSRAAVEKMVGDVELPDDILKQYLQAREQATAEDIEKRYAATRRDIVWMLIRDKIRDQFDVKVTEEDKMRLTRMLIAQQYAQYGMTNLPEQVLDSAATDYLKDEKRSAEIEDNCLQDKIYQAIRDHVTLDEKEVTVDEFNALFKAEA